MLSFGGKLAVVSGAGSGMGRELVLQLVADGCHVAMCDLNPDTLRETMGLAAAANPANVTISSVIADASNRDEMEAFAEHVRREHATDHLDLLFNNAGVGGGESFIVSDEKEWERTFDVCWGCVYRPTRAFLPLLMASNASLIVNTSSVNGFYASLGPLQPVSAYSAAKYAVKGFTESLITDLRLYAPNVRAILVMPGNVASSMSANSTRFHGREPLLLDAAQLEAARRQLVPRGFDVAAVGDDELRQILHDHATAFDTSAPLSSAQAATIILDGIKAGKWRILVGDDVVVADRLARRNPAIAYSLHLRRMRWYLRARFVSPIVAQRAVDRLRDAVRARLRRSGPDSSARG